MMWYGTTEVIIEVTMLLFPSEHQGWADLGLRSKNTQVGLISTVVSDHPIHLYLDET